MRWEYENVIRTFPSRSVPGMTWTVRQLLSGELTCDCPDFQYRGRERPCKHIAGVLTEEETNASAVRPG
jgi:hypothetical protein